MAEGTFFLMSLLQKTDAIVLGRRFLKENDALVSLLTEEGKSLDLRIYGIQKSRRRSAFLLEPGSLIHVDFYTDREGLASLKEGHVCERFTALKGAYTSMTLLSYFLELSAFAVRNGASLKLFLLLKGSLKELCFDRNWEQAEMEVQREILKLQILVFFQIRVLKLLGLLGSQEKCSQCSASLRERAHWNLPETSFSCEDCIPEASTEDRLIAWIFAFGSSKIFHRYKEELEKEESGSDRILFLRLWKNLNLCIELFAAKPFYSAKELGAQLQSSYSALPMP